MQFSCQLVNEWQTLSLGLSRKTPHRPPENYVKFFAILVKFF
ncbi:hypothetical protein HMPREF0322_00570 [Desulfitobacterium hafniense DP7]|uniref:Uncharacterized protein n=1 Tax=Desulfitobacterium hafniense DP7 TaxID=537010 RepID=G9XHZ4_DESHA|nr:hypothetical protein HMPREF0322_00570 [Desulfitobacterium hafniense DP7]